MKKLADGTEVIARAYYYLLDFNDADEWKTISFLYGKNKLNELTNSQFWNLLYVATTHDIKNK
jgi:hypothetical protein